MMKHAYLIVAHNEFELLEKLLLTLDYPNNDLFIHIDKKVKNISLIEDIKLNYSKLIILEERIDARWGDFSLAKVEMLLFKKSFEYCNYSYFHLISGADFPIKSQSEIHHFFDKNNGKEFIGFINDDKKANDRLKYYHLFVRGKNNKSKFIAFLSSVTYSTLLKLQKILNITRCKPINYNYKSGAQWVSLSNNSVKYLISSFHKHQKLFKHSLCVDEVYKQTLLFNSPFRKNIYNLEHEYESCCRLIDWQRGSPYVWQNKDISELINSDRLFARKFDSNSKTLIETLYNRYKYRP